MGIWISASRLGIGINQSFLSILFGALALLCYAAFGQITDPTTTNVAALTDLTKTCAQHIGGGPWANGDNTKVYICGDMKNALYWIADLDVDCDGLETAGKCGPDPKLDCCYQAQTTFKNSKGQYFTSAVDPYYVIPGNFPYSSNGISAGQIAAIIWKGKLTYAVFADTGPSKIIGEASYATAVKLGIPPSAVNGGAAEPVWYIVFTSTAGHPTIVEDHNEVVTKGTAAAIAFIQANGGSTQARLLESALPNGFNLNKRTLSVDWAGPHTLQLLDTHGKLVDTKVGDGPKQYNLAKIRPGVYMLKSTLSGLTRSHRVVLF